MTRTLTLRGRAFAIIATAAAAGMALSACAPTTAAPPKDGTAPVKDVTLTQALASDVTTLDPAKAANAPDLMMARMRFDTVVRRDDGGTVVSGLASKWEATPTSATLTLRDKLTCSDGSALTAKDVAASLTRLADPATKGASALVFGAGTSPTITADGNTVKVTLTKPNSDLLFGLSMPQAGVICAPGLKDEQTLLSGAAGVGSGPYFIKDKTPGSSYTLAASKDYHQQPGYAGMAKLGGQAPSTMVMKVYADEATMANDLLTGALDYAGITGPDAARLSDKTKFDIVPTSILRMYVVINQHPGHPGADPKVRHAIAQALSAKDFNQVLTKGTGKVMLSVVDDKVQCANTDASLVTQPDPAAAKQVLSGLKIAVEGTAAVAGGIGNEYVQNALKQAGANVTLKNADNATWATDVLGNAGDWDVTLQPSLNLTNLLAYPAAQLVGPDPQHGGRNFADIQNTEFANGFAAAMATTDVKEKCAAWQSAQASLLKADDVVPLVALTSYYITTKRTVALAPDGIYDPSTLRIAG